MRVNCRLEERLGRRDSTLDRKMKHVWMKRILQLDESRFLREEEKKLATDTFDEDGFSQYEDYSGILWVLL